MNRLLILTVPAITALALLAPTEAGASGQHVRKHHHRQPAHFNQRGFEETWATGTIRPAAAPLGSEGNVCPGSGRSFECKIWPPPFDQDPDRKASGSDAGG